MSRSNATNSEMRQDYLQQETESPTMVTPTLKPRKEFEHGAMGHQVPLERSYELPQSTKSASSNSRTLRSKSTGDIRELRSSMRVKSLNDSLLRRGLSLTEKNGEPRTVNFSCLEVREFPIILGDNPACMEGPPLSIDWSYDPRTQFVLDINTFERLRGERRQSLDLLLPKHVRERRLLKSGVTRKDMAQAVRQCRRDKHSRMVSCHNAQLDPMHEAMENATLGLKKILTLHRRTEYEQSVEEMNAQAMLST